MLRLLNYQIGSQCLTVSKITITNKEHTTMDIQALIDYYIIQLKKDELSPELKQKYLDFIHRATESILTRIED